MRKCLFVLLTFLVVVFGCCVSGCTVYDTNVKANVMIGDIGYDSLAEAIREADHGDTILVFDDIVESVEKLDGETCAEVGSDVYVAYEITKPLVIKGVFLKNQKPKVRGSFLINIGEEQYKDNSVTIDNLEIEHGYMSTTNDELNQKFLTGIQVVDGSVNIVSNDIHLRERIEDKVIAEHDLSLCYGVIMSRPKNSKTASNTHHYDITGNSFGLYANTKGDSVACPLMILENDEGVGEFSPAIINTKSSDYASVVFNENKFDSNELVNVIDIDSELNIYKSICVNNGYNVDYSKLAGEKCVLIFNGDLIFDTLNHVDVHGKMIFDGDVYNALFTLKNKDAVVEIFGEKLGNTNIIEYNEKAHNCGSIM